MQILQLRKRRGSSLLGCSVQLTSRFPLAGGTDVSNHAYRRLIFSPACRQAVKLVVCLPILSGIEQSMELRIWPAAS